MGLILHTKLTQEQIYSPSILLTLHMHEKITSALSIQLLFMELALLEKHVLANLCNVYHQNLGVTESGNIASIKCRLATSLD